MTTVHFAPSLQRFFPVLKEGPLHVEGSTVAELLRAVEREVPGVTDYILDEHGALRLHVNLFVNDDAVIDRRGLSDRIPEGARLHVFQALSGG